MKKLKKIVTLLTLAAVCLTAPAFGKITVKAAEPNTYVLNFSPSKGEWRFKPASSWSEEVQDRELYYMMQEIKDGDYIVVQNDVDCNPLNLNVPVRLGNLTIKNSVKTPVITAKGYDNVYVLDGTTAAINGDVSHAYVYGGARVNFNNNVDTLEMYGYGNEYNNLHAYINVVGTVNHLSAKDGQTMETYREGCKDAAKGHVKTQLVIDKILTAENIKAEKSDIEAKIKEQAESIGKTYEEYAKDVNDRQRSYIENEVVVDKLFRFLKENNEIA